MPVVFGVSMPERWEVDSSDDDWEVQVVNDSSNCSSEYTPQNIVHHSQLFRRLEDVSFLTCHLCGTVMTIEELVYVKKEFDPDRDVNDMVFNMQSETRSSVEPTCFICMEENTEACKSNNIRSAMSNKEDSERPSHEENHPVRMDEQAPVDDTEPINICTEVFSEMNDISDDSCLHTCQICKYSCHTPDLLYKHLEIHEGQIKGYKKALKHDAMQLARKEKLNQKLYKCSICTSRFRFKRELDDHNKNNHYTQCFFCKKYLAYETQSEHVNNGSCKICKKSTGKEKHYPPIKPKKFRKQKPFNGTTRNARKHKRHVVPKTYKCKLCGKVSGSENALKLHSKSHTTYKKCKICLSRIRSGEKFSEHMKNHENIKIATPHLDENGNFTSDQGMTMFSKIETRIEIENVNEERPSTISSSSQSIFDDCRPRSPLIQQRPMISSSSQSIFDDCRPRSPLLQQNWSEVDDDRPKTTWRQLTLKKNTETTTLPDPVINNGVSSESNHHQELEMKENQEQDAALLRGNNFKNQPLSWKFSIDRSKKLHLKKTISLSSLQNSPKKLDNSVDSCSSRSHGRC